MFDWVVPDAYAADLSAAGVSGSASKLAMLVKHAQLRFLLILRITEAIPDRGMLRTLRIASRVVLRSYGARLGFSIPPDTCGPGLSLPHLGPIIINDRAKLGSFCRLHTCTNIGERAGLAPTLGDFVYVAPGVIVYGGIVIGDGAVLGGNAVVGRDVSAWTTVAGAPGRKISDAGSESVMPEWLTDRILAARTASPVEGDGH